MVKRKLLFRFFLRKKLLISLITYSVQVILCKYNLLLVCQFHRVQFSWQSGKPCLGMADFYPKPIFPCLFRIRVCFHAAIWRVKSNLKYIYVEKGLGTSSPLVLYLRTFPLQKVLAFRLIADGSVFSFSTKVTTTQRLLSTSPEHTRNYFNKSIVHSGQNLCAVIISMSSKC